MHIEYIFTIMMLAIFNLNYLLLILETIFLFRRLSKIYIFRSKKQINTLQTTNGATYEGKMEYARLLGEIFGQ